MTIERSAGRGEHALAEARAMEAISRASKYFGEIRVHSRALIASSAGLGAGFLLNHYIANLFAPHLIEEFGWSRADFALIGTVSLLNLLVIPLVGRMTDLVGIRPVALVGVVSFPLTFVAYSLMSGSLAMFAAITVVQTLLAAATTTSIVYSRLVAERFVTTRGLALAIAATAPALVGVVGSPLLHDVIDTFGWRIGYLAVAVYVAIVGAFAILLIPPRQPQNKSGTTGKSARSRAAQDYSVILRSPSFWVICAGMLLCNLINPLQSSQMSLMLLEKGVSSETASWMISLFAAGVMLGRFICGVALDRFPAHHVAAIALGLPGVGLFLLAFGFTAPIVLSGAVLLFGLSLGAESDLVAYLVIRFFKIDVYGSVIGLVVTSMALSTVLGSAILSITLRLTDNFSLYMLLSGTASVTGAALFLLLGRKGIAATARI